MGSALKSVRDAMDAEVKASGGAWGISDAAQGRQRALIMSLWDELKREKPGWFQEEVKKTTDIAIDQCGRAVQKVVTKRRALACVVGMPFEDNDVVMDVGKVVEWRPLPSVVVPEAVQSPPVSDGMFEGAMALADEQEGELP